MVLRCLKWIGPYWPDFLMHLLKATTCEALEAARMIMKCINFFKVIDIYGQNIKQCKKAHNGNESPASSVLPDSPSHSALTFALSCFVFQFSPGYPLFLNNVLISLEISYRRLFIRTFCDDGGGFSLSFSSLRSSYRHGGFVILVSSANVIRNVKVKPRFFPPNMDINSYHPCCKSMKAPKSSSFSFTTSHYTWLLHWQVGSVCSLSCHHGPSSPVSVAWFKKWESGEQPLHYDRRADPPSISQSAPPGGPAWWCRSKEYVSLIASCPNGSFINYDGLLLNFGHDFHLPGFPEISLRESSVSGAHWDDGPRDLFAALLGWNFRSQCPPLSWFNLLDIP